MSAEDSSTTDISTDDIISSKGDDGRVACASLR